MSSQIMITSRKGQHAHSKTEDHMELANIVAMQRAYFNLDVTKSLDFRINQLKKMKKLIRRYEDAILEALRQDLGRHPMEGYVSEIMLLINEINLCIKKLKSWAKPKIVKNKFFLIPAKSKIYYEPFGVCLIISPWNYPLYLTLRPLIGAISAGNCATLKCSEHSPHTTKVILDLINQHFPQEYLYALDCDHKGTDQLIQSGYDFILYTGNTTGGKHIMNVASQSLTPLVLELGGKSPVIIDESADINLAAKRIVWAKYINSGQTCIAPDYIYVHISRKNDLIKALVNQVIKYYGKDPINNPDYGKIINENHFQRLLSLLSTSKLLFGGNIDEGKLKIEPTLVEVDSHHEPIMQEEIFGPILPVLVFKELDILLNHLKQLPKPLSLYYFSRHKPSIAKVHHTLSFGGGCINDCMMHLTNINMPFGGVGASGFGAYGGEQGFRTFSHAKSLLERRKFMLVDYLRITPAYNMARFKFFRMFAKIIGY